MTLWLVAYEIEGKRYICPVPAETGLVAIQILKKDVAEADRDVWVLGIEPSPENPKAIECMAEMLRRRTWGDDVTYEMVNLVPHAQALKAGLKFDDGKINPSFVFEYFPLALLAVSSVAEYGARKYTRDGWRTVPNRKARYTAADDRHRLKEYIEGPYDDGDSGHAHAAQHAWNALARLQAMLEDGDIELRRGNDIGSDGKPILGTARTLKP